MDCSQTLFEDGWTGGGRKFALRRREKTRAAKGEGRTEGGTKEGGDVDSRQNKCAAKR